MIEKTFIKYLKQCMAYARSHYNPCRADRSDVAQEDIAQEMLKLMWQSYVNKNGLSKVIQEQKLIPNWQLVLVFRNALRNLKVLHDTDTEPSQHPETVKVIFDENGEIIDYYYPSTPDPLEEEEEEEQEKKSKVPTGRERELWLQRIRRLKERGFSDEEILKILTPIKQGVLF